MEPKLSPEAAIALLDRSLMMSGSKASPGLREIFSAAAVIGAQLAPKRSLISSRLLVFGIGYAAATPDLPDHDVETRAIISAAKLFARDPAAFRTQSTNYFHSSNDDDPASEPDISVNVHGLLGKLADTARAKGDPVVTAVDFLLNFPPDKGLARRLLSQLGTGPDELHATVLAALEGGPAIAEEARRQHVDGIDGPSAEPDHGQGAIADGEEAPIADLEEGDSEAAKTSPTIAPSFNDSVATHADEPARIDLLERAPFAKVLARNIIEARASGESQASAFIVHIHGPWGAGKSSVLNFLEDELSQGSKPWLVVRFNAWRDQRRQPPWWSLITCIYAAARDKSDAQTASRLWWRWFNWRVRADYVPWMLSAALVVICMGLLVAGFTSAIGPTLSALGTTITLLGAGAVAVRSLALGSQRAAQTYAELKADPFRPMTTLFDRLIAAIGRPVAVFIDDLDRCDSAYVVDLLEGVQTLMRGAPVTYVVAADRKWICSSFEQKYAKFSPPIGEPGRPLGYLFLDKIFQLSAAVPQIASDVRSAYWQSLLDISASGRTSDERRETAESARRAANDRAQAELEGFTTHEQLLDAVERAKESKDPIAIQATRAAAAMRITSAEASAAAEHRLKPYARLLEPNPRSMKRLVNAYGMHQATLFLAGRSAPPDALARWTILELRWPLLADFLATRPGHIDRMRKSLADEELKHVPASLRELFGDELIVEVIGDEAAEHKLDPASLRAILGAVQGDR
jgi:hypothetical protein